MENIFIRRSLCLTWIHILWRWDTTWLLNVGRILLLILFRKLSLWVSRREIGSKALHLIWRFSRLRDEGYDDFEIHWKPYGEEWKAFRIFGLSVNHCEREGFQVYISMLFSPGASFFIVFFSVVFPWCFLFHCFVCLFVFCNPFFVHID